jgi:hypothetical protein
MSKTKSYNQIIFITTLSVYLGLVLVGASPQVLAQAALTNKFELKDQIEQKDDLDKKPDEELKNLAETYENYLDNLEDFIEDLKKLHQIEKFDSSYNTFQIDVKTSTPCNYESGLVPQQSTEIKFNNDRWLVPALTDFKYSLENLNYFSDCLSSTDFGKYKVKSSLLKINYDKSNLKIELSFFKETQNKAKFLAENLIKSTKFVELEEDEIILKSLNENTTITSAGNQVFIVTRLPRGSIDSLLK